MFEGVKKVFKDPKTFFKEKCLAFAKFVYNPETKEVLGRSCLGWARISVFLFIFYVVLGSIFAVHLVTYEAIARSVSTIPLAFAQFGYFGYPNSKIRLISTPSCVTVHDGLVKVCDNTQDGARVDNLYKYVQNNSMLPQECHQSLRGGLQQGSPVGCVFINIQRAFHWIPEFIDSSLNGTFLPVMCNSSDTAFQLLSNDTQQAINFWPMEGLQLDLDNANGRSFPFQHKDNFNMPVYVMIVNGTHVSDVQESIHTDITVYCQLNLNDSLVSSSVKQTHDYPKEVSFTLKI